jgi:hypothetical protein
MIHFIVGIIWACLILWVLKQVISGGVREGVKQALDYHNVNLGYQQGVIDDIDAKLKTLITKTEGSDDPTRADPIGPPRVDAACD